MISEQEARQASDAIHGAILVGPGEMHTVLKWASQQLGRTVWQDEPSGDGWYWCEDLPVDAPPQLFRTYQPLKFNPEDSTYSVDMNAPRRHQRWTVAGWTEPTGRVCKITERPA